MLMLQAVVEQSLRILVSEVIYADLTTRFLTEDDGASAQLIDHRYAVCHETIRVGLRCTSGKA